jgi:hypothetical protein
MALWELDEFKPATFLGFVRALPPPEGFSGTRWLPNRTVDDLEFSYILGANKQTVMAHVMGFDSEAPIHGRPGLGEKVSGELPPIKRKAKISEKEIIRFLRPRTGTADIDNAINSVYDLTADLLDAVQARLEWLRMQALSEDTILYNEGGVIFTFDFGINDEYQINVETATDGAGTSLASATLTAHGWDDIAAADPLPWLSYICDKVGREKGERPKEMVLSDAAIGFLLSNAKIRDLIRGTNAPAAVLSPQELNVALNLYRLPTLTPYDVFVNKEEADGSYTEVRTMAENKSFLVMRSPGETLLGPTAESRVVFGTPLAASAPGLWAETYGTTEPPAEWVKTAAVGFPSMPEADRLVQMTLWQ